MSVLPFCGDSQVLCTYPSPALMHAPRCFPERGPWDASLPALPLLSSSRGSTGVCELNTTECPALKFLCSCSRHRSREFCPESLKAVPKIKSWWKFFWKASLPCRKLPLPNYRVSEKSCRGCAKPWKRVTTCNRRTAKSVSVRRWGPALLWW